MTLSPFEQEKRLIGAMRNLRVGYLNDINERGKAHIKKTLGVIRGRKPRVSRLLCDCGREPAHYHVMYDKEERLCPISTYFFLYIQALEDRKAKEYIDRYPFEEYIQKYKQEEVDE